MTIVDLSFFVKRENAREILEIMGYKGINRHIHRYNITN